MQNRGVGGKWSWQRKKWDGAFVFPSAIDVTAQHPCRKLFVTKHFVQSQQPVWNICLLSSCTSAQDSIVRSERSENGALRVSAVPHSALELPFKSFVSLCIDTD